MLLENSTIVCMQNILKFLKRVKAYEAEVAKYIVRVDSISIADSHVGIFSE